jgi:hypothetical protein
MLFGCLIGTDTATPQTPGTPDPEQRRRDIRERRERDAQKRSDAIFQGKPPAGTVTVIGRSVLHSINNNGFSNTIAICEMAKDPKICSEAGFNEEQTAALKTARDMLQAQILMSVPKYINRFKTMTEAEQKTIQDDIEKDLQQMTDHVETLVTPEQKKNVQKLVFQSIGGLSSPMINLDTMSPLNLSDGQRTNIETTFKEMENERKAQMEEGLKLIEKAMTLGGANMPPEDREMIETERKALEAKIFMTGKNLGDKLRSFLTEEQREIEKNLLANRPKYLSPLPRQLRGDYAEQYTPGSDSWRPGLGSPNDQSESKKRRRPFPTNEEK